MLSPMRSLTRQFLALLLLIALLAVSGLGLAAYQAEREALETQVMTRLQALGDLKSEQVALWLTERRADVRLLAVNYLNQEHFSELFAPDIPQTRKDEFAAFLADNLIGLQRSRVGYREIHMVDVSGRIVVSTREDRVGRNFPNTTLLTQALQAPDGLAIQDIHLDEENGRATMIFAHTMKAIDLETGVEISRPVGLIVAVVDMEDTVFALLGPLAGLGQSAESYLVQQRGDTLVYLSPLRFHANGSLHSIPVEEAPEFDRRAAAGAIGGVMAVQDYRGESVLAVYRPVPGSTWGFVTKEDQKEALAPVWDLEVRLALLAFAVLVGVAGVAVVLARRLAQPITALAQAAQTIAQGALDVSLETDRQDELGDLARAFRTMVAALAERRRREEALTSVLVTLNATNQVEDVFQAVMRAIRATIPCESMSLARWDEEADAFQIVAVDQPKGLFPLGTWISPRDSVALETVLAGRAHITPDLAVEARAPVDEKLYTHGYRSRLVYPLRYGSRLFGVLSVGWLIPQGWREGDPELLTQFVHALSLALERSHLVEELRHRAQDLEAAYAELRQADQLKDSLLRNITHELRTPVTIVQGFVELLLDDDVDNLRPDQLESLRVVADQIHRLVRLINDVVALHHIPQHGVERQPLHLIELVRAIVQNMESQMHLRFQQPVHIIQVDAPDQDLTVCGDRRRLGQVLENLLDNALKFSPEGGVIRVIVRSQHQDGQWWASVTVQDPGIGMSPQVQERAWERFVQGDDSPTRRFGGTGLGLAVVKEVVESHGGRVWLESEEGRGTRIGFTLPMERCEPTRESETFLKHPEPGSTEAALSGPNGSTFG